MDGRYLSLLDMIDGGGAGRAGDTFQGGGILSELANALARPYGYEDRLRDRKNNTGRAIMTAVDSLRSSPRPQMRPSEPAGPSINPANAYVPMPTLAQDIIDLPEISVRGNVEGSGMTPVDAYDPEFQNFVNIQRELETEYGMAPASIEQIRDMFMTAKSRGYF
jgi:hypothetical protein